MIGWIILAAYCLGYLASWRTIVWTILDASTGGRFDGVDVMVAVLLGSVATLFWPLLLLARTISLVYKARGAEAHTFLMPRAVRRELALQKRERHIAAMERELGLGRGEQRYAFVSARS